MLILKQLKKKLQSPKKIENKNKKMWRFPFSLLSIQVSGSNFFGDLLPPLFQWF
jgi:hypothetical protein